MNILILSLLFPDYHSLGTSSVNRIYVFQNNTVNVDFLDNTCKDKSAS